MNGVIYSTNFFKQSEKSALAKSANSTYGCVDAGGRGDCGFLSIAACLIDYAHTSSRVDKNLLGSMLDQLLLYYPEFRSQQRGMLNKAEKLQLLLEQVALPEFIQMLAYVLRQMAVDEMSLNPAKYRGAFVAANEGTSVEAMRQSGTWIDETAMAALAYTLNVGITVHVHEAGKELPMRLAYNAGREPMLHIDLNKGHYTARVQQPEPFEVLCMRRHKPVIPATIKHDTPTWSEILESIHAEDKEMVAIYERTERRLRVALDDDELTKEVLIKRYIKGIDKSDYLEGRVKQIGLENGSNEFFAELLSKYLPEESAKPGAYDDLVKEELIHALSRAVSIGQLSIEEVFGEEEGSAAALSGSQSL